MDMHFWFGILLGLIAGGGAVWYFKVRAGGEIHRGPGPVSGRLTKGRVSYASGMQRS